MECLRIRSVKPELPILKQDTEDFKNVVLAMKNGYTIDQVKLKFQVSKEVEAKLKEVANEGV